MAKSQKKSSREVRKPKAEKAKRIEPFGEGQPSRLRRQKLNR